MSGQAYSAAKAEDGGLPTTGEGPNIGGTVVLENLNGCFRREGKYFSLETPWVASLLKGLLFTPWGNHKRARGVSGTGSQTTFA